MNDFASEDVIHSYPWRPAEESLGRASLEFAVACFGLLTTRGIVSVFFIALVAYQGLEIALRTFPSLDARDRELILQAPLVVALAYLVRTGAHPALLVGGAFALSVSLWVSLRTPSSIDLRWRSVRVGHRVIPYDSIRDVQIFPEPKQQARAAIYLHGPHRDSTLGRVVNRRHGKVDVCVTRRDAQAFARELRKPAHLNEPRDFVPESKKARAVRSLSPWS